MPVPVSPFSVKTTGVDHSVFAIVSVVTEPSATAVACIVQTVEPEVLLGIVVLHPAG